MGNILKNSIILIKASKEEEWNFKMPTFSIPYSNQSAKKLRLLPCSNWNVLLDGLVKNFKMKHKLIPKLNYKVEPLPNTFAFLQSNTTAPNN